MVRHIYDGARLIEEQITSGNLPTTTVATYVYGNYVDEILTMDRDGSVDYYHQNSLWSVEAITNSNGNVVERYQYDAYGQPTVLDAAGVPLPPIDFRPPGSSAIGNPWMFTGRHSDLETGLYYYRTRYLDSNKGRFISRDMIGMWGDPVNLGNGYAYVGNNPATRNDPFGLIGLYGLGASPVPPTPPFPWANDDPCTYPVPFEASPQGPYGPSNPGECYCRFYPAPSRFTKWDGPVEDSCCLSSFTGRGNCNLLKALCDIDEGAYRGVNVRGSSRNAIG